MSEPKKFYNPTNKVVEIMYNRKLYFFQPHQSRTMNGDVATHILQNVNSPLVEGGGRSWKELQAEGRKRGIYKVGMKKAELERLLNE